MISELMSNPSVKLFHRIVRRNMSDNTSTCTQYIKYNGKELNDPSEQIVAFKEFFEDLAMPKSEPHFDQDYADQISIKYEYTRGVWKLMHDRFSQKSINKSFHVGYGCKQLSLLYVMTQIL